MLNTPRLQDTLSLPQALVISTIHSCIILIMVSKFTIFSSILLASVALAFPSSPVEVSFARGHEEHQSRDISRVASRADAPPGRHWAGVLLDLAEVRISPWSAIRFDLIFCRQVGAQGPFIHVTGAFRVPTILGGQGEASVWIGFDGLECDASLSVGIYLSRYEVDEYESEGRRTSTLN